MRRLSTPRLVSALAMVLLLALLACGPSVAKTATPSSSTPTKAAGTTPSAAVSTPTATAIPPTATPTAPPATGGKVTASAADYLPAPAAADMAASQVLRLRANADINPGQMDAALQNSPSSQFVTANTSARLLRMKYGKNELVPDVSTGWEIKNEGKEITFTLRQGVQWQKGLGELTATDVVNHFKRMAGQIDGFTTLWKGNFTSVANMEAVDKYTVRFTFTKPDASFLRSVVMHRAGPLSKLEAFKQLGDTYQSIVPGVGPYTLGKWEKGVKVTLEKNPDYFVKGMPYLNQVVQNVITDDTVAELALKSGEIDADGQQIMNNEILGRFVSNPGVLKVTEIKGNVASYTNINHKNAPLDNIKVRQALQYAIDMEGWLKFGLSGRGTMTYAPVSTSNELYDDKCMTTYPYSVEKAKALLAEAGFPDGKGLRPLVFVAGNSQEASTLAQYAQQALKAVGVTVELKLLDGGQTQALRNAGNYDFYQNSAGAHISEPTYQVVRYYHTANFPPGNNNSYFDKGDALLDKLVSTYDPVERRKTFCSLLKALSDDVAVIGWPQRTLYAIQSPKVANLQTYDENVGGGYYVLEAWMRK